MVLLLTSVLPLLDSSLVNVLLPSIGKSFGVEQSTAQLGISGYMVAATVGIAVSATLMRRCGPYRTWMGSVVVFALASGTAGLSPTFSAFLAARIAQGLACGTIMPAVQALAVDIVGRQNMRSALATIGLPAIIAPALGPLVGGLLVSAIGWRALFLVNVPLAVIAICRARVLPHSTGLRAPLGLGQIIPAGLGLSGIVVTLTWLTDGPPAPVVLATVISSILLLALYVGLDLRSSAPLLGMRLYREPAFAAVMVTCMIVGVVFYGTLLSTSLIIQQRLGEPAWAAGIVLGVQGVGAGASRNLIRGPLARTNVFVVIAAGLLLAAAGTLVMEFASTWASSAMLLGAAVRGLGLGGCTLVSLSAVYEVVSADDAHAAGSHTRVAIQLGGALGTSLAGVWTGMILTFSELCAAVAVVGALISLSFARLHRRRP